MESITSANLSLLRSLQVGTAILGQSSGEGESYVFGDFGFVMLLKQVKLLDWLSQAEITSLSLASKSCLDCLPWMVSYYCFF